MNRRDWLKVHFRLARSYFLSGHQQRQWPLRMQICLLKALLKPRAVATAMAAAGVLRAGREAGAVEIAGGLPRRVASAAGINEAGAGNRPTTLGGPPATRAFSYSPNDDSDKHKVGWDNASRLVPARFVRSVYRRRIYCCMGRSRDIPEGFIALAGEVSILNPASHVRPSSISETRRDP
jgi:hypothetical protein